MNEPQLMMDLGEGAYCSGCILRDYCGEKDGPRACQPLFGHAAYGGVNVVHRVRPDFEDYFAEIGGPGFADVSARPSELPQFPLTTPRLCPRREFDGHLRRSFYAVGTDEAIISRRQVLGADEMREIVGLWSDQRLALMLFGKEQHLETIWPRRREIVNEIAECGYDFVAPPSYSALFNHPPSEAILNLKRSLLFYELLQDRGVPTAPRLAWLSEFDVQRAANWCEENPAVGFVVLDLAIKHQLEWERQLALLCRFDELTGRRLEYLIHGPHAERRLVELFVVLGERLRLTGSRATSRPRNSPSQYVNFTNEEEAVAYRSLLLAGSRNPETGPIVGLKGAISRANTQPANSPDRVAA
jgi:hypothetical protein